MEKEKASMFYQEILSRIDKVRRKENRLSLVAGVFTTLLIWIGALFVLILLEQIVSFGIIGRTILFSLGAICVVSSLGWFTFPPLLSILGIFKSSDDSTLALKIGQHFPRIRDRLLDAMQIYSERDALKGKYSLDLIDASFADLYQTIKPLDFREAVIDYRVRTMKKFFSYALAVCLVMLVVSPTGFFTAFYRIVNYNQSFASSLPMELVVEPGNVEVIRGETVPIKMRTDGRRIEALTFYIRQQGQINFDVVTLKSNSEGIFQTEVKNVKVTSEYYASVEDVKSDKFTISVIDRPLTRSLQLSITPPRYTRIPMRTLEENIGDISAYPGSKAQLQLSASKILTSAAIHFGDNTQLPLTSNGVNASGEFQVNKQTSYRIILKDQDGLSNLDPIEYAIKIIPDEYPTVDILSPAKNVDLTEDMKLDLFIRARDDFGFSKLRLAYRLVQSRYEKPKEEYTYIEIPIANAANNAFDLWHQWDLSSISLVPEDVLAYYIEVFDNDVVSGPKSGKSEIYLVRLPSIEEVFSDVSQAHQQSIEFMQSVAKETQQLKKDIEDLQREMKKNREKMDWQQQKKAEETLQRYESMKKKMEDVSQKMDEMMKKMEENKLLSHQTLEKYLELQKLMEQLNSPELKDALKKLQESMKQLSPEEMRQAMEQLKFSEEQFRQNLERTIELLKRIHIEQKIDELIKRTEEMIKQQEAIRKQTAETPSSDQQKRKELSEKQSDLKKQMEALEKETVSLQKKMEEFPKEMPLEEMAKAQKQLEKNQLPQKMQQTAQQMESGNMSDAQQSQEQSEKELNEFAEQMKQVQQALRDKQMQEIVNELRKQLQNILELSKREESLKEDTKTLEPNSQRFRDNAKQQHELMNDLGNVANALSEIAKKSFAISPEMGKEIGNAMRQMQEAMESMERRNPGSAFQKQNESMGSLNRAAMMMQGALSGLMQGGKGGMGMAGLMQRLGQMANAQGGINAGTQQAMGQGLSAQQQAEYSRLAGQQGAVQKSLEELSREAKNSGEFSKLLGDLDRVAQEMMEVQTNLEQGDVNPETMKKQERILSRLLDSQRSMRERDYEKRRRAESGKTLQGLSPAEIDFTTQEGRNRLREELLKVREGRFTKDYEELIRKYFEKLEKEEIKQ